MNKPIPWTVKEITLALGLQALEQENGLAFEGVSTDSRSIDARDLFVALRGELFDGHTFIPDLVKRGIKGFVVEKNFPGQNGQEISDRGPDVVFFRVDNTLTALGALARFQRLRAGVKVVAITGSNGKTSTRKMTGEIFHRRFNTLTTMGNFNNEIGLPLTLLKLSLDHEWAVVEMGMNHAGEINRLASIALPDIGVITNTAACHLEGLGTVEGVARAKAELLPHITANGSAVLNLDDPNFEILETATRANKAIRDIFCFTTTAETGDCVKARLIEARPGGTGFTLDSPSNGAWDVLLPTPGLFMVSNALAAACAALAAGIPMETVKQGLEAFEPEPGRMLLVPGFNNTTIIDDAYNANPGSVAAALETLERASEANASIAVLGDMLELGEQSAVFHRRIGALAAESGVVKLYAHGAMACHVIAGAVERGLSGEAVMAGSREEIVADLLKNTPPKAWILVKGSRGMHLEKIVTGLKRSTTIARGEDISPHVGN
ncbi:MAG: UDP-N-acetylmuramoyl-tripeptide--D-alanyl-D-alanine ligase [Desulfobacterium sp.]|jgi:UDP-N-acetylmuramoyl-tripeptide--D-alanyl-D-alanine ligase|nr:UDP-N-acetylmuramoyl-tripeptide--D-alanyl-D-alanine ligase [Desulfobacterium sp.]